MSGFVGQSGYIVHIDETVNIHSIMVGKLLEGGSVEEHMVE